MRFLILGLLIGISSIQAQNKQMDDIKQTIETFFRGFHDKDATLIQATVYKQFNLGSVFETNDGVKFQQMEGQQFIVAVTSRPDHPIWKESLGDYTVKISGALANAWVPYTFWLDEKLSHCGVNSIHLIATDQGWKIFNITDSRLTSCDSSLISKTKP